MHRIRSFSLALVAACAVAVTARAASACPPSGCPGGGGGNPLPPPYAQPTAPTEPGTFYVGQGLTWGHMSTTWTDAGHTATLVLQPDGNVVWYSDGQVKWSTGTSTGSDAFDYQNTGQALIMQPDGNLVLYNYYGKAL